VAGVHADAEVLRNEEKVMLFDENQAEADGEKSSFAAKFLA
jgi:hypothetical protein